MVFAFPRYILGFTEPSVTKFKLLIVIYVKLVPTMLYERSTIQRICVQSESCPFLISEFNDFLAALFTFLEGLQH